MAHLPLTILALLFLSRIGSSDNGTAVRLIQPAARSSERGFNVIRNAEAPCPTIKTISDAKNFVKSGKELEFVWFNPTAVKGTFRIQLLNANYELISTLLDSEQPAKFETNGLSTAKVVVPETECKDCIFRLVQETADGKAQLLSCADVDIVETLPSSVKKCEGDECTVECTKDTQCGTGSCIKGSCYCSEGYYGPGCSKESHVLPRQLNLSDFASVSSSFDAKNKLYWKILNDEIEFVLKFPINTWTVFGFRPPNVVEKCPWLDAGLEKKKLKTDGSDGNSLDGFGKELNIRKIGAENKTIDVHGCAENEMFSNCPEYSRECEASCDWTAFPESIPTCPRACGEARCVCKEGLVRAGNNKKDCVPFNVCQEDVVVECPQNETWAKCGTACEPTCDSMYDTTPCTQKCAKPACTCADNYVRLNGQCVFWSSCPNLEQKILKPSDEFDRTVTPPDEPPTTLLSTIQTKAATTTPSTSLPTTPIEDLTVTEKTACGENETFNECGKICEADCVTIFVRDECKECDKPACSCQQGFARNGDRCVYWGDCPFDGNGFETVAPKSTIKEVLEATKPTLAPKIAAVKSAVVEKTNKIEQSLIAKSASFVEPVPAGKSEIVGDVCFGEWRWPRNCRNNCDYKLSWNFNEESDEIEFSLEAKVSNNWWTGVGFSKGGSMKNADLIVVKVKDDSLSLHDMFSFDYDAPVEDEDKNVYSPTVIGSFVNGVLRTQFTRKRNTKDNVTDVTFTDKECFHFLFPVTGGRLDSNGNVLKHVSTPHVSPFPVCIRSCEVQIIEEKQEPKCQNEYKYPENCEDDECEYIAKWNLIPQKDEVKFEVKSRGIGRWSGIGLSKTGSMENSDIYTGWVYDGKAYVVDRFAFGKQLPAIDPVDRQDIYDLGGKIEDDYQTIWFTRKVSTNDKLTDYSLDGCYYFLFPIGGGRVLAKKTGDFQNPRTPIGYHDLNQPKISKTKICICDEHDVPIAAVPNRVRARRQVANPFEDKNEQPFVGLPDMAMIGQISIAELTGKAAYNVKMDPFACSDVTVLKVLDGGNSRVVDAFAQSKYGLEPDEFFGGMQSYSDIVASEDDGEAIVRFKRTIKAADVADHEFLTGKTQVFWANGPPDDSSVRLSGAAHVELLFVDFFDNTKIPLIADLEDEVTIVPISTETTIKETESTTTEKIEELTTTTIEETTSFVEESTTKVYNPETVTPGFVPTTTELMGFFEETTTEQTTTNAPAQATESNVIDEPDSAEKEVPQPPIKPPRINLDSPMCHGSFIHPPKCTNNCDYVLSWNTDGYQVDFQLWSKIQTEMWTGVGFSTEGGMMNADAIIVSVLKDGTVNVSDQYSSSYGRPIIDENQDIFDISTYYSDGELRSNFSRNLSTNDDGNDIDLQECQFFLFLQSGGKLESGNSEIRKHIETPISSGSRICLGKCRSKEDTLKETKTPETIIKKPKESSENSIKTAGSIIVPPLKPPTHFVYDAVLRFTNLKYTESLNDMNSDESQKISKMITEKIGNALKEKWPQLKKFKVLKFASGSVKSLVQMEFDGQDSPTPKQVEEFLRELAKSGKIGDLQVDPKELILKENKTRKEKEEEIQWKNFKNWAMLIGALILITIPILIALCCCFRRRRRQTYPTEPMSFAPPMHKPYVSPYISEPIYDVKNVNKRSLSSPKSIGSPKGHTPDETPKGMGETTYQEWYTKVASKDAPTHHQESTLSVAASRPHSRMSAISGSPYISYPHESGYYTLGGEHRLPPPSYYRHY